MRHFPKVVTRCLQERTKERLVGDELAMTQGESVEREMASCFLARVETGEKA